MSPMILQVVRRGPMSVAYFSNGAVLGIGGRPSKRFGLSRDYGFQVLVLTADSFQPPAIAFPGMRVVHVPLQDGPNAPPPSRAQQTRIARVGAYVAACIRSRKRVLVTCEMGLNRSATVAGKALRDLGMTGPETTAVIRRMRGAFALNRQHFQQIVNA